MEGEMAGGRPSPPCEGCDELRGANKQSSCLDGIRGVLLTAALDVVGAGSDRSGGRRAAVYAAHRTERRGAAGT
jgi:hypothetical protein